MINKYLLSFLVIGMVFSDVFAYVNDSGECMLMENISTMLEEYKTYRDKRDDLIAQQQGYRTHIDNAKAQASDEKSKLEGINKSAATKSNWAGGLSVVATAMNATSIGLLSATHSNNKKTMKNLDVMHDTLNEMDLNGTKVMDKEFNNNDKASIDSINQLKQKATCLKSFNQNQKLEGISLADGESLYLKGENDNINIGYLAFKGDLDNQQAYYCGENGIKAGMFVKMFSENDIKSTSCRWVDVKKIKDQFGKGSITMRVNDSSNEYLLKNAVNTINNKFDSMMSEVIKKDKDGNTKKIGSIVCSNGTVSFTSFQDDGSSTQN